MPTKKTSTPQPTDYAIQISINGADALGRDIMLIIRGATPDEFARNLDAVSAQNDLIVAPPTKFTQRPRRDDAPQTAPQTAQQPTTAPASSQVCPNGHAVYNNIADPARKPNAPLVRCPECTFRVWSAPRTDAEKQWRVWWEQKYGAIK